MIYFFYNFARVKRKDEEQNKEKLNEMNDVRCMIELGKLTEALNALKKNNEGMSESERYYLLGRTHLKLNHWKEATDCFLQAQALEPDGPATQQLEMINSIMDFFNKDLYNQ